MNDHFPFGSGSNDNDGAGLDDFKAAANRYKKIIIGVILVIIAAVIVWNGIYQVGTNSQAIITRFGKINRTEESGLRFKIPIVEKKYIVPTKRQLKEEFGFLTQRPSEQSTYVRTTDLKKQSHMMTGDLNVAIVEWIVHYQIRDMEKYLFEVRDTRETLRVLSESAFREIVGDYSVTEVLTSGREIILQKTHELLSELCKRYDTGISVQRIELKDSAPPEPVQPYFNEVNQAEQERDQKQNEALAKYNTAIPKAKGEADRTIEEAEGYAVERVNMARGDVAKFVALQTEYQKHKEVTRTRIYLETMKDILSRAEKKMIVDKEMKGVVPMLMPINNGTTVSQRPIQGGGQ